MKKEEIIYHWNYFRLLCKKFNATTQYIDHSNKNNLKVNSLEFQQCLLLTSTEFENVGKLLCKEIDTNFSTDSNIVSISKTILNHYNKIIDTKINFDYDTLNPLNNWKINNNTNRKQVSGLDWWDAYNDLKHHPFQNFQKASLENSLNALASLMVLELYLMKQIMGDLKIACERPCCYFYCEYVSDMYVTEEIELPDHKNSQNNDKTFNDDTLILKTIPAQSMDS